MYLIQVDLHGIEETITRPVLIVVSEDIKHMLGMEHDVFTVYDEKDHLVKKKSKRTGEVRGDNTFKEDRINIEYTEESEDSNDLSLVPLRPDIKPIYIDKDIDAYITPVYHSRKVSLKFRYTSKSKSKIFSIVNKLRLFTSSDSMYRKHNLEYSYTIPNLVLSLLIHINNLKNKRLEEPLSFEQYIATHLDDRADFTNTMDGDIRKSDLVMRECQEGALGYISDELHNIQPEMDEEYGAWYVEFTYDFMYEKPVTLRCKYPILIYNNLIGENYRTFVKNSSEPSLHAKRTYRSKALYDITTDKALLDIRDNNSYLKLPIIDTVRLPDGLHFFTRMFSVLIVVDDEDRTLLFNIKDIPKIKFRKGAYRFIMESEREYIGQVGYSLFNVSLYKDLKLDGKNTITLDKDGTFRSSKELDIKSTYRVMFNVVNDFDMLDTDALDRFKEFAKKQINDKHNDRKNASFAFSRYYWSNVDFKKYNNEISADNIYTDYLTLLNIDPTYMHRAIGLSKSFYEIPYKIKSSYGKFAMKTVARSANIALRPILEEK